MQSPSTIADLYFFSELQAELSDVAAREWACAHATGASTTGSNAGARQGSTMAWSNSLPSLSAESCTSHYGNTRPGHQQDATPESRQSSGRATPASRHSSEEWRDTDDCDDDGDPMGDHDQMSLPPMFGRSDSENVLVLCREMSNPGKKVFWTLNHFFHLWRV